MIRLRAPVALAALTLLSVTALAQAPASSTATAIKIEQPWLRATPNGAKVAAGYARIANTGTSPDRLVGAKVSFAGKVEVHEMAMGDGVMKMRALDKGLEIAPGQSVELKPGGYHLMFQDLSAGLKEGETVRGTLSFEKAGEVPVTFAVGGLGTSSVGPMHGR